MSLFCCVYGGFSSLLRSESDRRIVTATVRNRITSLFSFEPRPVRTSWGQNLLEFAFKYSDYPSGFSSIFIIIMKNYVSKLRPFEFLEHSFFIRASTRQYRCHNGVKTYIFEFAFKYYSDHPRDEIFFSCTKNGKKLKRGNRKKLKKKYPKRS